MQNNHYQAVPTLGNFRLLLLLPVSDKVKTIATIKSYNNAEIIFDMVTNLHCEHNDYFLSCFIASEHKTRVTILAETRSYEAHHFKANDLLDYNLPEPGTAKINECDIRGA